MADDDLGDGDDELERRVRSGDTWAVLAWTQIRWASAPGRLFARLPRWARWTYVTVAALLIVVVAVALIVATS